MAAVAYSARVQGEDGSCAARVSYLMTDSCVPVLAFAAAVGVTAEGLNHHPDLAIGWRKVTVSFTTHDAGNKLTEKDFAAAAAIDALGYPPA